MDLFISDSGATCLSGASLSWDIRFAITCKMQLQLPTFLFCNFLHCWSATSYIFIMQQTYHSDDCLDYAKVQETLGTIYLMTANLPQAKTHFKRAFKIYEKIWADEPEMIEAKYQEIQELYPQIGFFIGKNLSGLLTK